MGRFLRSIHPGLARFAADAPDPILEVSLAGVVTDLNPAARAQFPGLHTPGARHPLLDSITAALPALQQPGRGSQICEVIVDDRVYEQRLSYVAERRVVRSYILDITGRKRAEAFKDDFLSTVSHELRTPLATIKEFTEMIAEQIAGSLTADQRQYLGIIKANIERLGRFIDNLLDISKIESGHMAFSKSIMEVRALVEQVVQSIRPLAANKGLDLDVRVPDRLPSLFADADKITQVLLNLLGNAIKFTPAPGRVTLTVSDQANDLEFSVADTGVGISPEHLPRLFEKFHHVQPPGVGKTKGTGLGLAISKRLVELHGGRIWATSAAGQGSTLCFTLPKYQADELFHEYVRDGIERAKQAQGCFSLVEIAVANAQELKARYGPEDVSRLLKELETALRGTVRLSRGDVVLRHRGGETVVILAEVDTAGAAAMAQRLKRSLEERPVVLRDTTTPLSIVAATATYPDDGTTEEELLGATERLLHRSGQAKSRIMVIDDEPKIRQLLREVLEIRDYDVCTAASGPDALEQLKHQHVDLVLLDLMMPVMDGYEVYHLLKESPQTRDVPVIIVTAKGERKDRQLGLHGAAYNYIAKPFEVGELLAKVRDVLALKEATNA